MKAREKKLTSLFSSASFQAPMKRLVDSSEFHDLADALDKVEAPTLIVSCGLDTLIPAPEQETLRAGIKNSHYVVLPYSGHASMYEQPMLFAALLTGFANVGADEFKI